MHSIRKGKIPVVRGPCNRPEFCRVAKSSVRVSYHVESSRIFVQVCVVKTHKVGFELETTDQVQALRDPSLSLALSLAPSASHKVYGFGFLTTLEYKLFF